MTPADCRIARRKLGMSAEHVGRVLGVGGRTIKAAEEGRGALAGAVRVFYRLALAPTAYEVDAVIEEARKPSEQWLARRRRGITASDVPAILAAAEAPCAECFGGGVVSSTCDECGTPHCGTCSTCEEAV